MGDDLAWQIERERRALLLLAANQDTRQHVEAAGRHVEQLGTLLRRGAASATPAQAAPLKTA